MITILTPTYNRESQLINLYDSLINQSNNDFEWLVVDDGSTDDTECEINKWINEHKINIRYIRKENGGKHTALNLGIKSINSKWTFIVDSDDYLTEDAIEIIKKNDELYDTSELCGMAFLRKSKNKGYLTNKLVPKDGLIESFCDCRYGRGIVGDMAEVWKTKCLKENPFPEFKNEKFISEDVVWIAMSQKYKMIFFNKAIYISDYLDDGLTINRRKHNILSPKGCMYRGEIQLDANLPIKYKCRAMLYYTIYGFFAGYTIKELFYRSKHKCLYTLLLPICKRIYRKWRKCN